MPFSQLGDKDKERFLKELSTTAVWFGVNTAVVEEFGDDTLLHTLLLFPPNILEKLAEDSNFDPGELQKVINTIFFKFTSSLSGCLRPRARGNPINLRTLVAFSDAMDFLWREMVASENAYESHLRSKKGDQEPPLFLRYNRVLVEERFFQALCEASESSQVIPTQRMEGLLKNLSPREGESLQKQLEKINDLVAEARLREASKDDIANQLADLFDDFFKTEP